MNTIETFRETAKRVIDSGATENAHQFAQNVVNKINEMGGDWIETHSDSLKISPANFAEYADGTGEIAPVEDNRLFYLKHWQLTLADHV